MQTRIQLTTRLLMGLIFVLFGSNGLMMVITGSGFIPMPPPSPEMMTVMGGFFALKYLMPAVKLIQVICGVMFLTNRLVPLALILIAPIIFNILAVHLLFDPAGLPMAILLVVLFAIQCKKYKNAFFAFISS